MLKKTFPYLLLIIMLLVALWLRNNNVGKNANDHQPVINNPGNKKGGFDRSVLNITLTRHAKCRMGCRHISYEEVMDILQNGNINYKKSELNDVPCPTYALEGYTKKDNQHVRIVFAQCDNETKVVTCIDLDNEFNCDCK